MQAVPEEHQLQDLELPNIPEELPDRVMEMVLPSAAVVAVVAPQVRPVPAEAAEPQLPVCRVRQAMEMELKVTEALEVHLKIMARTEAYQVVVAVVVEQVPPEPDTLVAQALLVRMAE